MSLTLAAATLTRDKRRLLDGISLTLAQGEQAALIGPSGAGKSSLISLAATLAAPSDGHVVLLGDDPWRLGARARLRGSVGRARDGRARGWTDGWTDGRG